MGAMLLMLSINEMAKPMPRNTPLEIANAISFVTAKLFDDVSTVMPGGVRYVYCSTDLLSGSVHCCVKLGDK